MMLSSIILLIITCFQLINCSNLALKFDATKNVCTAACTTCSDANSTDTIISSNTTLEDILNTTKNILLLVENLLKLHNDSCCTCSPSIPTSCQEIKNKQPNSPSGVYLVETATNGTQYVYCNMDELCGSGGGWTKLAYLNMSDSTVNCPSGFKLYQSGGVRACGRATSSVGSCTSVQFPSNGISYSQVCGRVVGYQYASPDAIDTTYPINSDGLESHNDINSYYVDGVSVTRGSPRQHVWTLMAGGSPHCPCSSGSTQGSIQSFVGDDYYCESGTNNSWAYIFYTSDPLWDGQGCGSLETACCNVTGIPWFHRDYGSTTTTDYLELRVCADQETFDEDAPVSFYEIYVK